MRAPAAERDTLRWTLLLLLVDAGVWFVAASAWALHPALGLFFAYGALSLLITAALYLDAARGGRPGLVLKGLRAPWLQPLLLPFRAVSWCTWIAARALRRGDGPSALSETLWLGPRPLAHEIEALVQQGVRSVVDLTSELPTLGAMCRAPWSRLSLPTLDRTSPTDEDLDLAVGWILARRDAGERVYIHCAFGRGRSGVLACAALIALGGARDAEEALSRVRAARSLVRLREDQREAVRRFASRRARALSVGAAP